MTNPYPISKQLRETDALVGDGSSVYGPFDGLKVFDVDDIKVWLKPDGAVVWSSVEATVTKTTGAPFDTFSIAFPFAVPPTTMFKLQSKATADRSAGVVGGTRIDPTALEKELSKIATQLQELRRDVDRGVQVQFGAGLTIDEDLQDGDTVMKSGTRLVKGANATDITLAQGYAEDAGEQAQNAGQSAGLAEQARAQAQAYADGLNMPPITEADVGKQLVVLPGPALAYQEPPPIPAPLSDLSPLYLDQIITGFHGRGMLAAETDDLVTETDVAATSAAGVASLTLASAANILAGSNLTVKHDNGRYWTYWVLGKSGDTLTIAPRLKWSVSAAGGAKAERTWYNRAHAGKFYMRQLAQRLVFTDELAMKLPDRARAFFTQFIDHASVASDQLTAYGTTGAVNYFPASSTGTGGTDWPVRFGVRNTAYITMTAAVDGAYTESFALTAGQSYIARVISKTNDPSLVAAVRVMVDTDPVREIVRVNLPSGDDAFVQQIVEIPFRVPANVGTTLRLRFENVGGSGSLAISQIDIFPATARKGNILQERPDLRIVVCGDSWAAGDIGSTPERESFAVQLAAELPDATIINKGLGGTTIWGNLPNFQTIVADENPEVVILHTGVNECYNPSSATFNPNHLVYFAEQMSQFLSRCMAIGAKPIIIGAPALAEADSGSGYSAWTLNDRATLQSAYLYQNL